MSHNHLHQHGVHPASSKTSTLAIVSLIAGIATWIILPVLAAIIAVVTGHMAKGEIRKADGHLAGDGLATAGLALGYIQILILILAIIVLFGMFILRALGIVW